MDNNKKSALVDAAVAIVFFNRDDTLKEVFKRISQARPSELFLIQDGPRENNENDKADIEKCRAVCANIDWECKVHRNYAEKNMGCGTRVATGIDWVFENVESAIILEDDCVIEPSFIRFAAELLEKYKDDERVTMISGLNHFENWNCGKNSYFFTRTGAIAAWATWRRVWSKYDFNISDFGDAYNRKVLFESFNHKRAAKARVNTWRSIYEKAGRGETFNVWDEQFGYLKYKSGGLCIVPSHSLSSNIGIGGKATFSGAGLEFMCKPMRQWFFQKTKPMEFPLVHPDVMQPDADYDKRYYDITYPKKPVAFARKGFYFLKRKIYAAFKKKS